MNIMNKKNKNKIAKRRAQAKVKKQKRAKLQSSKSAPNVQFIERPPLSEIDTPPGYRAVSTSQAMIEYAKPLLDFVEKGIAEDPNDIFQLSMLLWNYDISLKQGDLKINKNDIILQIEQVLKYNSQESAEIFEMMTERKQYLFPDKKQPDHPMTMFIRQEERCLISEFNYDSLDISEERYLQVDEDKEFIELLNQMDEFIFEGTDYGEWESHYFTLGKKCHERFANWLIYKGLKEFSEEFSYKVEVYMDFIYRYMHNDDIILKTVTSIYIEEFFTDYVLRKVVAKPHEYVEWSPALRLFYQFLKEIGYFNKPEKIIKCLDTIEPLFIKILQEHFS